jgi:hypothetical protein
MASGRPLGCAPHNLQNRLESGMQSRRQDQRFQVRIAGRLMWAAGTTECVIVDLSESGARVDTYCFSKLPQTLHLFESKSGNIFECQVRWQQGHLLGLQFVDVCGAGKRRELIERHALRVPASDA